MIVVEPRRVELVVLRGRAEVPDVRIAVTADQRIAQQLVARPLADHRAGRVADVVLVERKQRAEPRARERLAHARDAIAECSRRKFTRSSKSTCVWPGAWSGRFHWCRGSMSSSWTSCGSTSADFAPFLIGTAFAADFFVLAFAFAFFAMLSPVQRRVRTRDCTRGRVEQTASRVTPRESRNRRHAAANASQRADARPARARRAGRAVRVRARDCVVDSGRSARRARWRKSHPCRVSPLRASHGGSHVVPARRLRPNPRRSGCTADLVLHFGIRRRLPKRANGANQGGMTIDAEASDGPKPALAVRVRGADLLRDPLLNKGTAFSVEERQGFCLEGLLPFKSVSQEQQAARIYEQLQAQPDPLQKYLLLSALQNRNTHLFYRLLGDHLEELMPIVYTPTVGHATQRFSRVFQGGSGAWITPDMKGRMARRAAQIVGASLHSTARRDRQRVDPRARRPRRGRDGDLGRQARAVHRGGGHRSRRRRMPVSLDFGTDNEELLADDQYLRLARAAPARARLSRARRRIRRCGPLADARSARAMGRLPQGQRARDSRPLRRPLPSFNDDIQGTGAVVMAGINSALDDHERAALSAAHRHLRRGRRRARRHAADQGAARGGRHTGRRPDRSRRGARPQWADGR